MKKIFLICFLSLAVAGLGRIDAQEKMKWKEMEAFHEVMAATFHPADEGKLEPLKTRSHELMEKASAWERSSAPSGYDKKAVKKSLKTLAKGTKELNDMVAANATDEALKTKLSSLHDTFHEIMEKCEKEDHK